jgi:outer membrane protein OmpA-like peptidoglycan-associated protein
MFGFFPARRHVSRLALTGTALIAFAAMVPGSAVSQQLTEKQMIEQLLGKTSRGATPTAAQPAAVPATKTLTPAETARLRELLDKAGTRAFTAKERTEVAAATRDRPSLDFEIYFPFNSSSLQKTALETMQRIGQLLTNDAFKDRAFLIAGHTDAKGKPDANRFVSQKRAQSVKDFLVKNYGIDPNRLRVIGYGKDQLKEDAQPFSAINRRVQIINLPDGTLTASR